VTMAIVDCAASVIASLTRKKRRYQRVFNSLDSALFMKNAENRVFSMSYTRHLTTTYRCINIMAQLNASALPVRRRSNTNVC
jgi:hypothetical protein